MLTWSRGGRSLRAGLVLSALLAVVLLARPLPQGVTTPVVYAVQTLTVLLACRLMWRAARGAAEKLGRARRLLAAAMACTFLGGVLSVAGTLRGVPVSAFSADDVVHLCFVPCAAAALLSFPVSEELAGSRLRSLLDGSLAATSLWFVVWTTVIVPSDVGARLSPGEAVLVLVYPAGDVFVIGLAASVIARADRSVLRELALLALGLGLYGAFDVWTAVSLAGGTLRPDHPLALLAQAGILCLIAGSSAVGLPWRGDRPAWVRSLPLLPLVPLALGIVVGSAALLRDEPLSRVAALAGVSTSTILGLRQAVTARDQRATMSRLTARDELFRSLVVGSADLITLHDRYGQPTYASPSVHETLARDPQPGAPHRLHETVHHEDLALAVAAWRAAMAAPEQTVELVVRLRCADGAHRWHACRLRNLLHDPSVAGVVINTRDIHEAHVLGERVRHDAYHDVLTGLGNLARARRLIEQACAAPDLHSVLLVDLDGFKSINDTYGHAQGDALLVVVAGLLRDCVRPTDEVLRIGGDEFLVVLGAGADADRVAGRVVAALGRPMVAGGRLVTSGGSVGIADTTGRTSADELLRNADLAMYAAKDAGRNRFARYTPQLYESALTRMAIRAGLDRALDTGGFSLHYQPVVGLVGGSTVAFEALLRWSDAELGETGPDVFVPVAEECGLMSRIGQWVLERACADLAAWRAAGLAVLPVSVNVSRTELTPALPALVADCLRRHEVPARLLRVEVTESAVVLDRAAALTALTELRRLGVLVLLDDFGTGQSSLSQLARLPVDVVKVDKSFVLAASGDPDAARLLDSILGVCRALDLPVVAEGIETPQVAGHLAAHGCQFGQGWLYGRPVPADQTAALLGPRTPLLMASGGRAEAQTAIRIGSP